MAVLFQLEEGKPQVEFRFTVASAYAFEEECGSNPAFLITSGKQLFACVKMLKHGLNHADPTINDIKAKKRIQTFLDNGGKMGALSDALIKAYGESGVYGDPDDLKVPSEDGEASESRPT